MLKIEDWRLKIEGLYISFLFFNFQFYIFNLQLFLILDAFFYAFYDINECSNNNFTIIE